jgi:hypothetical protein
MQQQHLSLIVERRWEVAKLSARATASGIATARAEARVRYSFTAQYLTASVIFAKRSAQIEKANPKGADQATMTEHRGLVTATIMQCVAAIEAESAELTMYGPGHHLGSTGTDANARDFLAPLAELIDTQSALDRYNTILHLLRKQPLDKGKQPWQHMEVLVRLRNELIHYKSKWDKDMDEEKLFKATLKNLRLAKPSFIPANTTFFPHQFLSAACAAWSVRTAVAFLNRFYDQIEIKSPLQAYMHQFEGL